MVIAVWFRDSIWLPIVGIVPLGRTVGEVGKLRLLPVPVPVTNGSNCDKTVPEADSVAVAAGLRENETDNPPRTVGDGVCPTSSNDVGTAST